MFKQELNEIEKELSITLLSMMEAVHYRRLSFSIYYQFYFDFKNNSDNPYIVKLRESSKVEEIASISASDREYQIKNLLAGYLLKENREILENFFSVFLTNKNAIKHKVRKYVNHNQSEINDLIEAFPNFNDKEILKRIEIHSKQYFDQLEVEDEEWYDQVIKSEINFVKDLFMVCSIVWKYTSNVRHTLTHGFNIFSIPMNVDKVQINPFVATIGPNSSKSHKRSIVEFNATEYSDRLLNNLNDLTKNAIFYTKQILNRWYLTNLGGKITLPHWNEMNLPPSGTDYRIEKPNYIFENKVDYSVDSSKVDEIIQIVEGLKKKYK